MDIVAILNSAILAAVIGLLVKSFSIGRAIGQYETKIEMLEAELTKVRVYVHKLSNDMARLSGRDELRDEIAKRERKD